MDEENTNRNDEVRLLILRYFYSRNQHATSLRGKKGAAVKISEIRRHLKEMHGLRQEEVLSNLRYLISQGWVEEQHQERVVPVDGGRRIPRTTPYYAITALGIDKIDGPGDFTPRDRFSGITISASGQSTVTVGDGNQVNAKYTDQAEALAQLAKSVKRCDDIDATVQMDAIANIDTIQSQLSRAVPDTELIKRALKALEPLSRIATLANNVMSVSSLLRQMMI